MRHAFTIAILLAVYPFSAHAQATMYVTSPTAELKSDTGTSAQVLVNLSRGTGVTTMSTKGNWVQASVLGKTGWIYKFKLSSKKPSSSTGSGLLAGLGGGGASAREGSSATSIRGLSPTSEKYAGRAAIKPEHVQMVKHMESVQVTENEVQAFLKAGKLGEYAQ